MLGFFFLVVGDRKEIPVIEYQKFEATELLDPPQPITEAVILPPEDLHDKGKRTTATTRTKPGFYYCLIEKQGNGDSPGPYHLQIS